MVTPADVQGRDAARTLLESVKGQLPRLLVVWADGAYAAVALWAATACHFVVTAILRPLGVKGFVVLPKRWIVERTFAWLGRYRRLSKDYEANPKSSEAWIYLAASRQRIVEVFPPTHRRASCSLTRHRGVEIGGGTGAPGRCPVPDLATCRV
jgi:transposase